MPQTTDATACCSERPDRQRCAGPQAQNPLSIPRYAAECVEGLFSEVRLEGFLRSSAVRPRGIGPEFIFSPTAERVVHGRVGSVDRRHQKGRAASPSRCSGRPGAGHDSKDARPLLCEKSLICSMRSAPAGITIGSRVKPGAPYFPPPGAARLFSWPYPPDRLGRGFLRTSR